MIKYVLQNTDEKMRWKIANDNMRMIKFLEGVSVNKPGHLIEFSECY